MTSGLEIHEAASTGDSDTLEELLRTGKFDVNLKDEEWNNKTPLHWACARGYVECIRLLIDHGANGLALTDIGWTPAHFAAETGKLTVLRALYNAGIPLDRLDKYGDTPRRVAEIYGQTECVKFLEQCSLEDPADQQLRYRLFRSRTSSASSKRRWRMPSTPVTLRSSSPSSTSSQTSLVGSVEEETLERRETEMESDDRRDS